MCNKEALYSSVGFDSSQHNDLMGRRPWIFAMKVAVWGAFTATGYALMLSAEHLGGAFFLGLIFAAAMAAHGVELEHQALHEMGFESRFSNRAWGVLLGLPMLISFSHYKDRHLHHHVHVGTPEDSEFFAYSKEGNHRLLRLLSNLMMLPHWAATSRRIAHAVVQMKTPNCYNSRNERPTTQEYRIFGVALVLLVVAGIFVSWKLLVLPVLVGLVASPLHTLLELPEHLGCELGGDVFRNTRSITSNAFTTWLTNGNNFHVEHHLLPSVVPERLHLLHTRIGGRIVNRNGGYGEFIATCLFSSKN